MRPDIVGVAGEAMPSPWPTAELMVGRGGRGGGGFVALLIGGGRNGGSAAA